MSKKIISLFATLVLFFCFGVNCFAVAKEEPGIQPYYSYTADHKTILAKSSEKLICKSTLSGIPGTTTKVKITMTLEKKVLFWWSEKETWTQTFNSYSGTLSKTYSDANSGTYRISAEYVAYSGTKSETITDTSAEVKI